MPDEVRIIATSLRIEMGKTVPRPLLLSRILNALSSFIIDLKKPGGKEKLLSTYTKECDTIGREVSVLQDGEKYRGRAVGITDQVPLQSGWEMKKKYLLPRMSTICA